MKMKVLLDMNLSPSWVGFLQQEGFEAAHWSAVGDIRAPDATIMSWARENGFIVFTHDLDFSALLAATQATGPSVVQLRTQDLLPEAIGHDIVRVLRLRATDLERGAIISIDKLASRVRVLPIRRGTGEGGESA
jgi:predicted nuclease of predicted toxin-antitoxin system